MDNIVQQFKKMLSAERLQNSVCQYATEIGQSAFESDYTRMVMSAPVRRLQDKAQVFPLERTDFLRTRLTHSLEVANVGVQLGTYIESLLCNKYKNIVQEDFIKNHHIVQVLQVAGLIHDIGNPPYGHYGEQAIRDYFIGLKQAKTYKDELKIENTVAALIEHSKGTLEKPKNEEQLTNFFNQATLNFSRTNAYTNRIAEAFDKLTEEQQEDLLHFDGNVQDLRLLTKLGLFEDRSSSFNLTSVVLATIIKYPFSSTKGNKTGEEYPHMQSKFGYFDSEKDEYRNIIDKVGLGIEQRHPLTFLLEAADDITYSTCDIEDGFRLGIITLQDIIEKLQEAQSNPVASQEVKEKINQVIEEINQKNKEKSLLSIDKERFVQRIRVVVQQEMIKACAHFFVEKFEDIINGQFREEILGASSACLLKDALSNLSIKNFSDYGVIKSELLGGKVIATLMDAFVQALFDDSIVKTEKGKLEINRKTKAYKLYSLISPNYKNVAKGAVDEIEFLQDKDNKYAYKKFQLVTDFVAGMTDKYALQIYHDLIG